MSRKGEPLGFSYAFRDLLISLVVVFMGIAALALIPAEKPVDSIDSQGQLVITSEWDMQSDSDIDLWLRSPTDSPVGYSRPGGTQCNMVRDDRGRTSSSESRNAEMIICRSAKAGEYIINVVAYHSNDGAYPISVRVKVTFVGSGRTNVMFARVVLLKHHNDQITVIRFKLDDNGKLRPGSVNRIPVELFHAGGSQP